MILFFTFYLISLTLIYLNSFKHPHKINKIAECIIHTHTFRTSAILKSQNIFSSNTVLVSSFCNKI